MKFFAITLALAFVSTPAFAYIDPGTGTLVWQALAAAAIGILFQFNKLKNYFRKT